MTVLSIVSTSFNNFSCIKEFYHRVTETCETLGISNYEIIMVDDGSDHVSFESIHNQSKGFQRFTLIRLSRNFGHHKALLRGIAESRGDRVFIIDSDLEESPEWLGQMYSLMESKNCDSVYGVQRKRRGGVQEKLSGWLFYLIAEKLFGVPVQKNMMTARLMSRRFAEAVLSMDENNPNLSGIFSYIGFTQEFIQFDKPRLQNSKYTLGKKLAIVLNLMTSFSTRPLKLLFATGVAWSTSSVVLCAWITYQWLNGGIIAGWTSLMVVNLFFGGIQLSFLGVLGLYIARIFSQVKNRPKTIVESIFRNV